MQIKTLRIARPTRVVHITWQHHTRDHSNRCRAYRGPIAASAAVGLSVLRSSGGGNGHCTTVRRDVGARPAGWVPGRDVVEACKASGVGASKCLHTGGVGNVSGSCRTPGCSHGRAAAAGSRPMHKIIEISSAGLQSRDGLSARPKQMDWRGTWHA